MVKVLLLLSGVAFSGVLFAQQKHEVQVDAYWDIALSANVWPGAYKTVGIQTTGGAIINKRFSIGLGLGIGSRNYEYLNIPIEIGAIIWGGNGSVRIYGGPTYELYRDDKGYLAGTELVFRPRFDMRNLKLFIAAGFAFDNSGPDHYFSGTVVPMERNTVIGPRIRIGLGL